MTVKDRLVQYLQHKRIGQNAFERAAGISNGYISNLRHAPGDKVLTKILQHATDLNRVWLLTGEGEMLNSDAPQPPKVNSEGRGIPIYDDNLSLGFVENIAEPTTRPIGWLDLQAFRDCTCICRATGQSMEPTISSGDLIVLQRITDRSFIVNNEIYAVATMNGMQTIKRMRCDGDAFILVADNPDYGQQRIEPTQICQLYRVRGILKTL